MNKKKLKFVITATYILAVLIVGYPIVSSLYNGYLERLRVVEYKETVSEIDEDKYLEMLEVATAWNEELYAYVQPSYFPDEIEDTEIYESLLNLNGDGMIGYVIIPKIDVELPIYHYSTDEVLQKGAGHLESSALPVGGENTHCVITAHRGLPNSLMFTNLDQLEIGDVFYIKVLDETLAYEVINIQTVDPDETSSLAAVEGEDLCTLVTCTPYGVNTQRLLVTGSRIEYTDEDADNLETKINSTINVVKAYWLSIVLILAETIIYIKFILIIKAKKTQGV